MALYDCPIYNLLFSVYTVLGSTIITVLALRGNLHKVH